MNRYTQKYKRLAIKSATSFELVAANYVQDAGKHVGKHSVCKQEAHDVVQMKTLKYGLKRGVDADQTGELKQTEETQPVDVAARCVVNEVDWKQSKEL